MIWVCRRNLDGRPIYCYILGCVCLCGHIMPSFTKLNREFLMSDDSGPLPLLIIWILLLAADFICTAFSEAAAGLSESDLKEEEEGGEEGSGMASGGKRNIRKELSGMILHQDRMISTSVFWQIAAASSGALILEKVWGGSIWLPVFFSFFFTFIFGWALPGIVGKVHGMGYISAVFSLWKVLNKVSMPFTFLFGRLAAFLGRMTGSDPSSIREEVTEDEIISMVNEGHQQGTVDEDEAEMIRNIFEMDEKQAQDIMTVRGKIIALADKLTLDDAIRTMVGSPNSRFPVYSDSIDNIIGALYLKDAMSFHMKEEFNQMSISDVPGLLREVKFVPETRRIDELFSDMQKSQLQIAIVVDEYGETAGLVTMEDILEEIVGNIFDEYDRVEKLIVPVGKGRWRISGMAPLSDVTEALGAEENEDYETLNGYLTARLDHVPGPDDVGRTIADEEDGILFTVRAVRQNTIQWALAEKKQVDQKEV